MKLALFSAAAVAAVLFPLVASAAPVPSYTPATTPYTGGETFFCVQSSASAKCDTLDTAKTVISTLITGTPTAGHCVEWNSPTVLEDSGSNCNSVTAPGASGDLLFNSAGSLSAGSITYLPSTGGLYSTAYGAPAFDLYAPGGPPPYGQINTIAGSSPAWGLGWGASPTTPGAEALTWAPQETGTDSNVQINGDLTIATSGNVILGMYTTRTATGNSFNLTNGNVLDFGSGGSVGLCYSGILYTLEVDNGECSSTTGSVTGILKAGTLSAPVVTATTTLKMPDGGEDTIANGLQVGSFTGPSDVNGIVFEANNPSYPPTPAVTGDGAGVIGLQSAGYSLGPSGEYLYPGLIIRGWATPQTSGCASYCADFDVTLMDAVGNVIAGVWGDAASAGHPNPFVIGATRTVTPTAVNEGYPLGQLFLGDIVGSGSVEGPMVIMQADQAGTGRTTLPNMIGLGKESPNNPNIFVGSTGNTSSPWDDTAADQVDLDTLGCLGTGVGSSSAASEGTPVNYLTTKLCALDGGGIEVMNAAKSAARPIEASFYRITPTTVSGLSTLDAAPAAGDRAMVTDATTCAFNSPVVGGGATKCPVVYTGSWVAG